MPPSPPPPPPPTAYLTSLAVAYSGVFPFSKKRKVVYIFHTQGRGIRVSSYMTDLSHKRVIIHSPKGGFDPPPPPRTRLLPCTAVRYDVCPCIEVIDEEADGLIEVTLARLNSLISIHPQSEQIIKRAQCQYFAFSRVSESNKQGIIYDAGSSKIVYFLDGALCLKIYVL